MTKKRDQFYSLCECNLNAIQLISSANCLKIDEKLGANLFFRLTFGGIFHHLSPSSKSFNFYPINDTFIPLIDHQSLVSFDQFSSLKDISNYTHRSTYSIFSHLESVKIILASFLHHFFIHHQKGEHIKWIFFLLMFCNFLFLFHHFMRFINKFFQISYNLHFNLRIEKKTHLLLIFTDALSYNKI